MTSEGDPNTTVKYEGKYVDDARRKYGGSVDSYRMTNDSYMLSGVRGCEKLHQRLIDCEIDVFNKNLRWIKNHVCGPIKDEIYECIRTRTQYMENPDKPKFTKKEERKRDVWVMSELMKRSSQILAERSSRINSN